MRFPGRATCREGTDARSPGRRLYASDTGRDTFNGADGIYAADGELTLSMEDDGALGVMTFDVQRS